MSSFSTALRPAQAHTAICCNSHKTELKGLGEGYCPGSSVLPVLGYYFWKPCILEACLAQGIMPKQKSFHAGIILGVTGIQQVLMLVAPSVALPFPAAVNITRDFVALCLEIVIFFSPTFLFPPTPKVNLLINHNTVFLTEVWMCTRLRCLTSNLPQFLIWG